MTNLDLLYQLHFDNTYAHVIDFVDATKQEAFFDTKVFRSLDNMTVVRENEEVKIDGNINSMYGINYCRYTNKINDVEKTFYAFITRKEYVNPFTTRLVLEVDVYQTYMFDFDLKQSFIERQHEDRFNTDFTPIHNTVDEALNYGSDYIKSAKPLSIVNNDIKWLYIGATELLHTPLNVETYVTQDKKEITHNIYVYALPYITLEDMNVQVASNSDNTYRTQTQVHEMIQALKADNKVLFMVVSKIPPVNYTYSYSAPFHRILFQTSDITFEHAGVQGDAYTCYIKERKVYDNVEVKIDSGSLGDLVKTYSVKTINDVTSITHEPKLHIYPYLFHKVYYGGSSLVIKNNMLQNTSKVKAFQGLSSDFSSLLINESLKNSSLNDNENILSNQTPNYVTLITDAWKNYMSANRSSRTSGYITAGLQVAIGAGVTVATGGLGALVGGGATISGVASIANKMSKEQDIKNTPDDVKQFAGDMGVSPFVDEFFAKFVTYEITAEFKQKLFKFFQMYGYKSNAFKVPDVKSRYYYNYIKTNDVNLTADLNQDIIQKLKSIYNNGVTVWHYRDAETFKGLFNFDYENLEMSIHNGGA